MVSATGIFLLVDVWLIKSLWSLAEEVVEGRKMLGLVEESLTNLKNREADLQEKIRRLSTEAGLDKEIRERFPVARPGEEVIMVVGEIDNGQTTIESREQEIWWKRLLEKFGF